jgi:hypothetical protein
MALIKDDNDDDDDLPKFKRTGFDDVDEELALNTAHKVTNGEDHSDPTDNPIFPLNKIYKISGVASLAAQTRIAWFRLNCPEWTTEVDIVKWDDTHVTVKAKITDETGRLRASNLKRWPLLDKKRNSDFAVENACTSALARAITDLGYNNFRALSGKGRDYKP